MIARLPGRFVRIGIAGLVVIAMCAVALVATPPPSAADEAALSPADNLEMIRSSSVRNTNHDASPWRDTPMADLDIANHLGPRSDYLGLPGGNPEQHFPVPSGGQFRTSCEFSHFAYDDPLVHPDKPGAAHLHMFFGNTDTNAFTTYDSLFNTGSSTCNGQELNRSGYWAPAMFDGDGNVRIPERIVVYYKGEGLANGRSQVYPPGAAMIPEVDINTVSTSRGGARGKFSFTCSDQWSAAADPQSNTIPGCDGDKFFDLYGVTDNPHVVLEMNVKFPQCWNGADASDPDNFSIPDEGGWYYSLCPDGWVTLPNLEYFVNYRVELGENTRDWYLASDVDPMTGDVANGGSTLHADWWGGWHPEINERWIDNCVNFSLPDEDSGCGMGYLTNAGPDNENPLPGPALKFRPQYEGPSSVSAEVLHAELCPMPRDLANIANAAYCTPAGHDHDPGDPTPPPVDPDVALCAGEVVTIMGTSGDDYLVGTGGADVIDGRGGDDTIEGRGGRDIICGGRGADTIFAGRGNDLVRSGPGDDRVDGGDGDDRLSGSSGDDTINGQAGDDRIWGGGGADSLRGESGSDVISGGSGDDRLVSGSGSDDRLRGGPGTDTCVRPAGSSRAADTDCEVTERGYR